MASPPTDWPVSRRVVAATVPTGGQALRIEASDAERAALAAFLEIESVEAVEAALTLKREGSRIRVAGRVRAEVTQACVLTLEPVPDKLDEEVDFVFAPPDEVAAAARALGLPEDFEERALDGELDLEAVDFGALDSADALPDPITDGMVDAGGVLVETIALALDPYPHAPGATFGERIEDAPPNPFAALAKLKGSS
jgi:uncharacterized metal-binding protein YceD (DUF177 family)